MKVLTSILVSMLATTAVARLRIKDEGDTLPEKSRITAFVVDKEGNPSVECWELHQMINDMRVQRQDGSKATARSIRLASGSGLDGLDILTWPALSPIWPPSMDDDQVNVEWFDFSSSSLFSIQNGMISFRSNFRAGGGANTQGDDEEEIHVFSLENGDDWFYFEDEYSGSIDPREYDSAPPPFIVNTISGSETEVLALRFGGRPKYKVVHKGACHFTGIRTPGESGQHGRTSRKHNSLKLQRYGNHEL